MRNGYQIVEPKSLSDLLVRSEHEEFSIAVCAWLIDRLRTNLAAELMELRLDVIWVTYMGSYPAIGIQYLKEDASNVGPRIESEIEGILASASLVDFIQFLVITNVSWREAASRLRAEGHWNVV